MQVILYMEVGFVLIHVVQIYFPHCYQISQGMHDRECLQFLKKYG